MKITFTVVLDLPATETLTEDEIRSWTRDSLKYGWKHQDYDLSVKEILDVEEGLEDE